MKWIRRIEDFLLTVLMPVFGIKLEKPTSKETLAKAMVDTLEMCHKEEGGIGRAIVLEMDAENLTTDDLFRKIGIHNEECLLFQIFSRVDPLKESHLKILLWFLETREGREMMKTAQTTECFI